MAVLLCGYICPDVLQLQQSRILYFSSLPQRCSCDQDVSAELTRLDRSMATHEDWRDHPVRAWTVRL